MSPELTSLHILRLASLEYVAHFLVVQDNKWHPLQFYLGVLSVTYQWYILYPGCVNRVFEFIIRLEQIITNPKVIRLIVNMVTTSYVQIAKSIRTFNVCDLPNLTKKFWVKRWIPKKNPNITVLHREPCINALLSTGYQVTWIKISLLP